MNDRIGKTTWFDLPTKDPMDARSFYEGLFNWRFLLLKDAPLTGYWVIQAGEDLIGGLRQAPAGAPIGAFTPVLYFTVNDVAASSNRVKELGGKLVGEAVDLKNGRGSYQMFRDREGNLVALWGPSKESV